MKKKNIIPTELAAMRSVLTKVKVVPVKNLTDAEVVEEYNRWLNKKAGKFEKWETYE